MGNCTASQRAVESWADDGEWEEEASSSEEGDHHRRHHDHHEWREEHASEVTIRITKRQLHELMEKRGSGHGLQLPGLGSRRSTEQLLADIMNSGEVHHHREERWHWKPALQSIPEAVES
ncbi:protein odd-skipped [Panicum miliaceum]|uniref:Protein odd-skipped n=1 Tax=Panicum miliaceum TaxID=4540 RepID=A0A3L6SGY8_PANMI|nr:protein odd-skipped [Panicum miliaceum]